MKRLIQSAIAAAALAVSAPASAAIIFDFNTGLLTVDSTTTVGSSTTIDFNGFAPGSSAIPGLTSSLTLTFQGLSGNNYLFDYLLMNTSSSPIDASRVTMFGFTSITPNPNLTNSLVTGAFGTVASGNLPGGSDLAIRPPSPLPVLSARNRKVSPISRNGASVPKRATTPLRSS